MGAIEFGGAISFGASLPPAILALADGTVFHGPSIGASGIWPTGEVVFNTAMTGYQEILSDPSYCRQLVTLTYPQIGNYGVNDEDMESDRIHAEALIVKALPVAVSNWRAEGSLQDFLARAGKPGIAGIDTRKLTRLLREKGAQGACLIAGDPLAQDIGRALNEARNFAGLAGMDLAKVVSVREAPYQWHEGGWSLEHGHRSGAPDSVSPRFKVVAYDFGIKRNILRMLVDRGCDDHRGAGTDDGRRVLRDEAGRRVPVERPR